ncbi:ABC transporter substrate-binding protein [Kibdelosporangium aridum]|uniref:ABC transporter substrate-binding protein n=1 Tax=Kibdelosporangium aridum TaxID=2030 RepID=A0A428ZEN5_KIBAR|nr:ABC transporter substrate-binding protein [Kibdelosporangium aridum]RSM86516.1 ABC transporter substrate-binding protein [Kibdelosporangium aridum]
MLIGRVLSIVLAGALLAGCGTASQEAPRQAAPTGAFPVTIKNAYGETVIKQKPQRVVTLGLGDIAVSNALGANIVGSVKNYTGKPLPYLRTKLDETVYAIDPDALNIEKIAAYRPDVILALTCSGLDQAKYNALSKIAPVVTYEKELYSSPMDQDALTIGRALGDEAGARKLVDDANASIAKVKSELPRLAGKTYLYGQARGDVLPIVVGKDNMSTKFMASLGLRVPDAFASVQTSSELAPGTIGLSYETADQLDTADALFMTFAGPDDQARFESNPLTRDLKVIKEGRYQATTIEAAQLLQAPDVVGVDYLLNQLKPTLAKIGS